MTVGVITDVLGGPKLLKQRVRYDADLKNLIRRGLPVQTLAALARDLSLDRKKLASVVGISERTLSRRVARDERLTAEESDRTVRLAFIVALATDTFGSAQKASVWLQTPNAVLDGELPLDLLDTDTGVRSVETVLGRIAYGVYS